MGAPGPRPLDLTGHRFGRLVAVSCLGMVNSCRFWSCQCDCGTQGVEVRQSDLRSGISQSCGCLRREILRRVGKSRGQSIAGQLPEMRRLRNQGLTMRQIGERLGISRQRVSRLLRRGKDDTA
jgi:hypothetical protein